jgi:hypothetical protein
LQLLTGKRRRALLLGQPPQAFLMKNSIQVSNLDHNDRINAWSRAKIRTGFCANGNDRKSSLNCQAFTA